jgi:hypothetical protein
MQQVKFWTDITQKRGTKDKSLPTYGTVVTFISEHIHLEFTKSGFRMLQNPKKRQQGSVMCRSEQRPTDGLWRSSKELLLPMQTIVQVVGDDHCVKTIRVRACGLSRCRLVR